MLLVRALSFDVRRALGAHRLIVAALLVFLLCRIAAFLMIVRGGSSAPSAHGPFSLFDVLVFLNRGMDEYEPRKSPFFILDLAWMAPLLLIGLSACLHPVRDIKTYSMQTVPRIGSRMRWFASKAFWTLVLTTLYYLAMLALSWVATALFGSLSADAPTVWTTELTGLNVTGVGGAAVAGGLLLGYAAAETTALLVTGLTMVIGPVWSYFAALAGLVLSAYFKAPVLFFSYGMLARSDVFLPGGFALPLSLAICAGLAAASLAGGLLAARRTEYL